MSHPPFVFAGDFWDDVSKAEYERVCAERDTWIRNHDAVTIELLNLREAAKLARRALLAETNTRNCVWCGTLRREGNPHHLLCSRQLALAALDAALSTPTAPLTDLSAVSGDV